MMKKLKEHVEDSNNITTKIKNREKFKINLTIILPLLNFMKTSALIDYEEFNMIINNKSLKIKELKYLEFNDYSPVAEKN